MNGPPADESVSHFNAVQPEPLLRGQEMASSRTNVVEKDILPPRPPFYYGEFGEN